MKIKSLFSLITMLFLIQCGYSQEDTTKSLFWEKVQFGGGLGLGIGNGFTNISVAPSAIYNFNDYVATGLGIQYSYIKQKGFYDSNLYGGSLIVLVNPIREIQLSGELEQLRVNSTFTSMSEQYKDNFWNTALFVGVGYRSDYVTLGVRYNVLHNNTNRVYTTAFMPFVRIYF